jgi:hypothetical protein
MTDPEAPKPPAAETLAENQPAPAAPAGKPAPVKPELIGGRFIIALLLLGAIALVSWQWLNAWVDRALHPRPRKASVTWTPGVEADVEITLITADAKRLSCASDTELEGVHCAYGANKRPWRRTPNAPFDDNDVNVIQPYRTADTNVLIMVSGLWAQPELAMRLHREPPNLADVDKHLRFVAYCRVRFVGELTTVSTRWDTTGKWTEEPKAMLAKPIRCTLQPPNG